ncbi:MAG: phage Gp37/Gp68 family protein [Candidatus Riflebacteria bacterium]|nr:phage Gp37/Gp68 family protein [Candidatus Riflebacteria bacterium]
MMAKSSIEWTESTWNPLTGCTKISPGCKNCYAERMARRLKAMGQPNYRNGFQLTCHEHVLERPMTWKKPQMVFVNSMSDLFHEAVPSEFILKAFRAMKMAHWHTFQVLTNGDYTYRIDHLRGTGAKLRFLSLEPLLGPVHDIRFSGIDWVIAGGESGPGARPMAPAWVVEVRDQCVAAKVPFFFKQWGGFHKKRAGRLLEGQAWDEVPTKFGKRPRDTATELVPEDRSERTDGCSKHCQSVPRITAGPRTRSSARPHE